MLFPYKGLSGAQIICKKLVEKNISKIFAYTGGPIMPLIDTFYNHKDIKLITNTHEQSAGHAATAIGRLTGKPGICVMTSGPGVTNSITALTDATNDSTPLILLTGNVPLKDIGSNAFQEVPATEITKPITKWSYLIKDVHEIPDAIDEAFIISTNGKPGAVHLDIPKCVLNSEFKKDVYNLIRKGFGNRREGSIKTRTGDMGRLSVLINSAKRPLLIIGQGCNNYANKLKLFALKSNIPVATTIHALGIFDETHELSLNFLGMHGLPAANYAVQEADLIIALGTRFDDRTTGDIKKYAPNAFKAFKRNEGGIIHVLNNSKEIKNTVDSHYNYYMDCGKFLESIKPEFGERNQWFEQIKGWKKKHPFNYVKNNNLKTQDVIRAINRYLLIKNSDNHIITTGVGNHQMMACQYITWRIPKSLITSGSLGVMGVGLPFAIGSQLEFPDKLVIDIDGDGSFNQTLSELKTVMNYNLPIKIAVLNDTCFSMVGTWEKLFYDGRHTATDLNKNPDYVRLARSYGIKAMSCHKHEDLPSKIEEFLSYKEAILCEFKVSGEECLPLIPPNAGLDEMIMFKK